jgi:hypothetical protein
MAVAVSKKFKVKAKKFSANVSPEAVELYLQLKAIRAEMLNEISEAKGGRANEFNRKAYALCKLLGIDRWQSEPTHPAFDDDEPEGWLVSTPDRRQHWESGRAAHVLLEEVAGR